MPELPEVETVRKALLKKNLNKTIKSINIIYPKIFVYPNVEEVERIIKNQQIINISRYGKWLIFELTSYYLLSHLRMEGKYIYRNLNEPTTKHELVSFMFNDYELRYLDVRKFGKMYLLNKEDLYSNISPLSKLGLEPWNEKLTTEYLKDKYLKKTLPIKTVLLDQSIITGIGNIYADEILFLSKINPYTKAKDLVDNDLSNIIKNTKKVLEKAISEGGTTIRSYTSEEGITGKFQNDLYVHKRENEDCKICSTKIKKDKINGRGTYYCPNCQK